MFSRVCAVILITSYACLASVVTHLLWFILIEIKLRMNDLLRAVPNKITISGASYCSVLETLMDHIKRKLLELAGHWILCHDNARPHVVNTAIHFLTNKGIHCIPYPPYSPDLAPLDFFHLVPCTEMAALRTVLLDNRCCSQSCGGKF